MAQRENWAAAQAAAEAEMLRQGQQTGTVGNTPYGGGAYNQSTPAYGGRGDGAGTGPGGQRTPGSSQPSGGAYGYNSVGTYPGKGQWYNGINIRGMQDIMNDDSVMFDEYYSSQYGLPAGSNTGMWMADTFNPYAIADALGNTSSVPSARAGQGGAFAQLMGGANYFEMNPAQIVVTALQNIAKAVGSDTSGPLQLLTAGTPTEQMNNTLAFLRQALAGLMPEESFNAYMYFLQKKGLEILQQSRRGDIADFEKGGGTFASKLLQALGPTGGL